MDTSALTPRHHQQPARRWLAGALLGALAVTNLPVVSAAELPTLPEAQEVNNHTTGIVFHYEETYRRLIADMTEAFKARSPDGADAVRMVPIIGVNHVQTLLDMLYMQGVDLGIVHSDVFEYLARNQGNASVYQRINSLVELYVENTAIIAGTRYETLEDLAGQTVNFGTIGKGSDVTGTVLFDVLGIDVDIVRLDKLEALEQVKSGEIAASIYLADVPIEDPELRALTPEDNVRLLPLPQTPELLEHYHQSDLTQDDFPNLIDGQDTVASLGVPVIIASYNWPRSEQFRYGKSLRFMEAFIASLDTLKQGDNAALWEKVSLSTDVPGVPRLALVDTILAQQSALREQREEQEASDRAARLQARQEQLTEQLANRLDQRIAEVSDPAELDALLQQLQQLVDKIE